MVKRSERDVEAKAKAPTWKGLLEAIDQLSRISILASAACCIIGILIVNLWLGQFGYQSLSLLRVEYISAGLWTLLPIVPWSIVLAGGLYIVRSAGRQYRVRAIAVALFFCGVAFYEMHFVSDKLGIEVGEIWLLVNFFALLNAVLLRQATVYKTQADAQIRAFVWLLTMSAIER